MSEDDFINRSLTRRGFLGRALAFSAAALVLPKSLDENVAYVRRVWALDRTMTAVRETVGEGWFIQSPVDGLTIVVVSLDGLGIYPLTGRVVPPELLRLADENVLGSSRRVDTRFIGETATLSGPVYVTRVGEPTPRRRRRSANRDYSLMF